MRRAAREVSEMGNLFVGVVLGGLIVFIALNYLERRVR